MDLESIPYLIKKQFFSIITVLRSVIVVSIVFIYVILFYYQVVKGNYYYNMAEKNRLRMYIINAPRGIVYDRNNTIIVENRPSISVFYYPVKELYQKDVDTILSIIPSAEQKLYYGIKSNKVVLLGQDVDRETVFKLFSLHHRIGNIFVVTEYRRKYVDGELFSHIVGYVSEISYDEYLKLRNKGYTPNDFVGKTGIEKVYEEYLKGINGALLMEVDVKGNPTKVIKNLSPKPGNSVYLTIDKELQKVAREALIKTGKNGAVVGIDPRNGAIRILVSYKDFDPNLFTKLTQERRSLLKDPSLPMFNRAVQGIYPPGSTFKILTTIAALNEKKCSTNTTYFCNGGFQLGDKIFKCWQKKGHGSVNLSEAIRLSCNVYFINLGLRIGIDDIERYAKIFGLGQKTDVDLPFEVQGVVPSKKWKKEIIKFDWFEGDTASVSIGQGYIAVTPLQMAMFVSAVANRGIIYQPYIVEKITDSKGNLLYYHTPIKKNVVKIEPFIWDFLLDAMKKVVISGTGAASYIPGFPIAGKTGTAQNPHGKDHAWFICFGPAKEDEPAELALAIVVEHGGTGGTTAAPIAKEIFKKYIEITRSIQIKETYRQETVEYGD